MIGEDASLRMFAARPGDPGCLITVLAAGAGHHLRSVFTNTGWHPGSSILFLQIMTSALTNIEHEIDVSTEDDDHIELSTPSIAQH